MAAAEQDHQPAADAPPCEDCEPKLRIDADRALGAVTVLVGAVLLLIGIDRLADGALSRAIGGDGGRPGEA